MLETLVRPVKALPLGFHYACGRIFSRVLRDWLHYREDVVLINLSRAFPEKKYAEIKRISDRFYDHIGEVFAEAMWFGGCGSRPGKLHDSHICEFTDLSEIQASFRARPSVMILASHRGNWELYGGLEEYSYGDPQEGFRAADCCCVYRRLKSPFWDRFFKDNRMSPMKGVEDGFMETMSVLRYALRHREEHKFYVFTIDQFPFGRSARCELPSFLNQKTWVMTGAAALAVKLRMAVYYMRMDRQERGHYVISFRKLCEDAAELGEGRIVETYHALLEEDIRRQPENYLWSHKRWK